MEQTNGRHKLAVVEFPGHPGPGAGDGRDRRDVALQAQATVTPRELYRFDQAYRLSVAIEAGVKTGRCHWRAKDDGRLLETWGEVIGAIMADNVRVG